MRLRRRGTPWGCLVVVQFTLTGVPQWKSESLFGAGIQMKFRELPVNSICGSFVIVIIITDLLAGVECACPARSGDVFVT
jgi:hypothetical protein